MRKFSIPCSFGDSKSPFEVYIGEPIPKLQPLFFQSLWLETVRGGTVPPNVLESFQKLEELARRNNVSFEDLCAYALEAGKEELQAAQQRADEPSPAPEHHES